MVRTVPYGLSVGQIVTPLVDSEMTNGKMATAKTRYEVRVIYPGGAIVRSASFAGRPFPGDVAGEEDSLELILAPGGLLKRGTPVHVEGEPDPTDDELARFVNAGILGTSLLTRDVSDASDFAGRVAAPTGVWDYRVDPTKRVRTPRQASVICDILIESGKTEVLESEVLRLVTEHGARLQSKQDPTHIFRYYKKTLVAAGFLSARK